MSDRQQQLHELRNGLVDRHQDILRRVVAIEDDLRQTTRPRSTDWEEAAQEAENDEVLEQLDDQGRAELEQIETALRRFDEGNYGQCIDCEAEISLKRLQALPSALRCIDCAEARDERN